MDRYHGAAASRVVRPGDVWRCDSDGIVHDRLVRALRPGQVRTDRGWHETTDFNRMARRRIGRGVTLFGWWVATIQDVPDDPNAGPDTTRLGRPVST